MANENVPPHQRSQQRSCNTDIRKVNKPLMEKKRRERINKCLDQLKALLMDASRKENSYYSKLEKADILELTVKYLKNVRRDKLATAVSSENPPAGSERYVKGFVECKDEVIRYLHSVKGMSPEVQSTLMGHLSSCLHKSPPSSSALLPSSTPLSTAQETSHATTAASIMTSSSSNRGQQPMTSSLSNRGEQPVTSYPLQLVPAQLPSGDIVLVLANSAGGYNVAMNGNIRAGTIVGGNATLTTAGSGIPERHGSTTIVGLDCGVVDVNNSIEAGDSSMEQSDVFRDFMNRSDPDVLLAEVRKSGNANEMKMERIQLAQNSLYKSSGVSIPNDSKRVQNRFSERTFTRYETISPPPSLSTLDSIPGSSVVSGNEPMEPHAEALNLKISPIPLQNASCKSGKFTKRPCSFSGSHGIEDSRDRSKLLAIAEMQQNDDFAKICSISGFNVMPYEPALHGNMDDNRSMWRPW